MNPPTVQHVAAMLVESMESGQQPILTVTSNSMAPLLRAGDHVQIEPVTVAQLQTGDIITILTDTDLLTHRYWGTVIRASKEQLLTRGDRVLRFDPTVDQSQLLGRVINRHRQQKVVYFTQGNGRFVNKHLIRLGSFSNRHLVRQTAKLTLWHRLLHRLTYYGAVILCALLR